MKYKHIVFDADGTLLDTEYAILLSLQDTVKAFLNKQMEFADLGIIDFFTTSVCKEDTTEHKPTPVPLLKYMEIEGVQKEDVIYIGDSKYDSMCAHGAGVDFALAVWGSHTKETPAQYYPETPKELLKYVV